MDKEQKIAEIREALEKIDRGDLFEIAMAHEKSGEWLRFLLDELERVNGERNKLIEVLRWYADEKTMTEANFDCRKLRRMRDNEPATSSEKSG